MRISDWSSDVCSSDLNVVINGFGDADAIEKERAGIEKEFGVKAFYINADLMQSGATRGFIDESVEALGGIDILVNNAGIQHTDLIEDFPVEKWNAIIALNLSAVFHGTRSEESRVGKESVSKCRYRGSPYH